MRSAQGFRLLVLTFIVPAAAIVASHGWALSTSDLANATGDDVGLVTWAGTMLMILGLSAALGADQSRTHLGRRAAIVSSWWIAGVSSVATIEATVRDTRGAPPITVTSILVGLACCLVGASLAGRDPARPTLDPVPPDAPHLADAQGRRIAWHARVRIGGRTALTALAWAAFALAMALVGFAIGAQTAWVITLPGVLWTASLLGNVVWHVRINASGLSARPWWTSRPRLVLPADEIERADSAPAREGLPPPAGLSTRGPDVTLHLRGTRSLIVHATAGRRYVVTMPDAEEAARVLNTVAARTRPVRPDPGVR